MEQDIWFEEEFEGRGDLDLDDPPHLDDNVSISQLDSMFDAFLESVDFPDEISTEPSDPEKALSEYFLPENRGWFQTLPVHEEPARLLLATVDLKPKWQVWHADRFYAHGNFLPLLEGTGEACRVHLTRDQLDLVIHEARKLYPPCATRNWAGATPWLHHRIDSRRIHAPQTALKAFYDWIVELAVSNEHCPGQGVYRLRINLVREFIEIRNVCSEGTRMQPNLPAPQPGCRHRLGRCCGLLGHLLRLWRTVA